MTTDKYGIEINIDDEVSFSRYSGIYKGKIIKFTKCKAVILEYYHNSNFPDIPDGYDYYNTESGREIVNFYIHHVDFNCIVKI